MIEPFFTAQYIYDHAPLGAVIRYTDGTPKPPARFKRKHADWECRNNQGRLTKKAPESRIGSSALTASLCLHTGDYGSDHVVVLKTYQSFSVESALRFQIVQRPRPGSVRVLSEAGGIVELLHLADSEVAAQAWLARNPHANCRFEVCEASAHQPTKTFTFLQDPAHGWLLVSHADLQSVGLSPADFSCCSYVNRELYALEEDCDMPVFIRRLEARAIAYQLVEQHTNHDAYVRRWQSNPGAHTLTRKVS